MVISSRLPLTGEIDHFLGSSWWKWPSGVNRWTQPYTFHLRNLFTTIYVYIYIYNIYNYNHLWQFHGWFTAGCLKFLSQNSHVTHRIGHFLYPKLGCCLPRFDTLRTSPDLHQTSSFWRAISNKNKSLQIIYVIFWMVILEPSLLPKKPNGNSEFIWVLPNHTRSN